MRTVCSYVDSKIRPELYREGFDPMQFLRLMRNDDGTLKWSLDYEIKRHWFRLIYPDGRIDSQVTQPTPDCAVVKVRVYASRNDKTEEYLSEATAMRSGSTDPNCKFYERYFLDSAETAAASRALSNAGFDLIGCNTVAGGQLLNPLTGEPVTESQAGMLAGQEALEPKDRQQAGKESAAVEKTRSYSDKTAPPPESTEQPKEAAVETKKEQVSSAGSAQEPQKNMEPMTFHEAKSYVIPVGTYKGMTVGDLALRNPGQLDWYLTGYKGHDNRLLAAVKLLLDAAGQKQAG